MFGCFLALILDSPRMINFLSRFKHPGWVVFAALFPWILSPMIERSLPGHWEGGYGLTLGVTLTGICIAFVVAWLITNPGSMAGKILNSRLLVHFGVLSYSLYLWQQLFLTKLNTTWTGIFPLNIFCAYLAALLSHHLVERPFLNLKAKLAGGNFGFSSGALPKLKS
jgi:peptidoglycan/LPS O-acetylase OafA/YrhL